MNMLFAFYPEQSLLRKLQFCVSVSKWQHGIGAFHKRYRLPVEGKVVPVLN
jgi:hypothetical protein